MARALALALGLALSTSQVAIAAPPGGELEGPAEVEAPAGVDDGARGERDGPPIGTLSEQGTRRGALEFGVASVLTATAIGLAAFGTVQFIRAREHVIFCNESLLINENGNTGIDPCVFDPPPLGFASAGLSWGLSLPLLVGAGLLFTRGAEVLMDARRHDRAQLSLRPWWRKRAGGASLTLRF